MILVTLRYTFFVACHFIITVFQRNCHHSNSKYGFLIFTFLLLLPPNYTINFIILDEDPFYSLLRQRLQFLDLFNQIRFFVIKLLIIGPVVVEFGQEINQFILISQQNVQNGLGFVGIGNEHL